MRRLLWVGGIVAVASARARLPVFLVLSGLECIKAVDGVLVEDATRDVGPKFIEERPESALGRDDHSITDGLAPTGVL